MTRPPALAGLSPPVLPHLLTPGWLLSVAQMISFQVETGVWCGLALDPQRAGAEVEKQRWAVSSFRREGSPHRSTSALNCPRRFQGHLWFYCFKK